MQIISKVTRKIIKRFSLEGFQIRKQRRIDSMISKLPFLEDKELLNWQIFASLEPYESYSSELVYAIELELEKREYKHGRDFF